MVQEMESLQNNDMWDFIQLSSGRNLVDSKWVLKKNMNVIGQVRNSKLNW
jgi:hypothetical protein